MPKFIVHFGAHKTGSTLLQANMHLNRDAFLHAGLVVVAPQVMNKTPLSSYFKYRYSLMRDPSELTEQRAACAKYLRDLATKHPGKTVLLSNEDVLGSTRLDASGRMYPMAREAAEDFAELTGGSARAIFYIREQAGFIESCYGQQVKQGRAVTVDEFVGKLDLSGFDWNVVISAIEASFGPVKVKCFESIRGGAEPYYREWLRDVFWLADLGEPPQHILQLPIKTSFNLSYSQKGHDIALRVNELLTPAELKIFRAFLSRHFNNTNGERARLFAPMLMDAIRQYYWKHNERLLKAHNLTAAAGAYRPN